jgi:hypothetical protein
MMKRRGGTQWRVGSRPRRSSGMGPAGVGDVGGMVKKHARGGVWYGEQAHGLARGEKTR